MFFLKIRVLRFDIVRISSEQRFNQPCLEQGLIGDDRFQQCLNLFVKRHSFCEQFSIRMEAQAVDALPENLKKIVTSFQMVSFEWS